MVLSKAVSESDMSVHSTFASRYVRSSLPRYRMPENSIPKEAAYQIINDELMLDGNPRLNLASFVTTWMEPECDKLIMAAINKNYVDMDEYPVTTELQNRCVNMIAHLFNAPLGESETAVGVGTVGSSEAIMLAGLAFKRRWQNKRRAEGKPFDKPNIVTGANVQVLTVRFHSAPKSQQARRRISALNQSRAIARLSPAGLLGEVREVLRGGAQGGEAARRLLRDGPREGGGDGGREHHLRRRDPGLHAQRRVRGREAAQRPAPSQEQGDPVGDAHPRGRGERRLHRALPVPGPGVGLPPAAGQEHQRQRPQVRPRLRRHRLVHLAQQGGPAGGTHLPHQLPRRRPAHVHAQLLQGLQPSHRAVLPAHPPRLRGVQEHHGELPRERHGAQGGPGEDGPLRHRVQGRRRPAGGLLPQGPQPARRVRDLGHAAPLRLDRAGIHHAPRRAARHGAPRRHPGGVQPHPRRAPRSRHREGDVPAGRAPVQAPAPSPGGAAAQEKDGAGDAEVGHGGVEEVCARQEDQRRLLVTLPPLHTTLPWSTGLLPC
uniref:glutamate decarboxylase n=1 Tax=Zea mays TaxID=4577 RepID=A0A804R6U9_MAIZE